MKSKFELPRNSRQLLPQKKKGSKMKKLLPILLLPIMAGAEIAHTTQYHYQNLYLAEKMKQQHYQKELDLVKNIDYKGVTQDFFDTNEENPAFEGTVSKNHYIVTNNRYNYLFDSFPNLRERIISTSNENTKSGEMVSALVTTIHNLSTYINNHVDYVGSSVEYSRYTYPVRPTVVDSIHTRFSYNNDKTILPTIYRINHFFDNLWIQRVKINGVEVSEINFTTFKEN